MTGRSSPCRGGPKRSACPLRTAYLMGRALCAGGSHCCPIAAVSAIEAVQLLSVACGFVLHWWYYLRKEFGHGFTGLSSRLGSLLGAFSGRVYLSPTAMSNHRDVFALFCLLLALLSAGCQRGGIDRLPIHGTVQTAKGEKFDASISFLPLEGKRPVANGSVKNGEFRFGRIDGPTAGPTKVVVRRIIHRDQTAASRTKPAAWPATKDGPPAKSEWTMSTTILDDGKYIQDFTLKD